MNTTNHYRYFKNGLFVGLGVGAFVGLTSAIIYQKHHLLSADDVLKQVKAAFLEEGPLEGSWIEHEQKPIRKFAIHSQTYHGGITRLEDNQLAQYRFVADAKTGTVLEVTREMLAMPEPFA